MRLFNRRSRRAPIATKGAPRDCPQQNGWNHGAAGGALNSAARKTAAITMIGELMARFGGVAWRGAAELASAPDEREC